LERRDLPALASRLNGWFASYVDHLDYREDVLGFLRDHVTGPLDASVVAEDERGLLGVWLAGVRDAAVGGERGAPRRVANLAVLAVSPVVRRQGLASALEAAGAARARALGADAIGLMTQEIHPARSFYERRGYRVVSRFQPPGAQIGEVERVAGVREVDLVDALERLGDPAAPPGVLVEAPRPLPTGLGVEGLRVRAFVGGDAVVVLGVWPVLIRIDGAFRPVASAEILHLRGGGTPLLATLATALAAAREAGCAGCYALPGVDLPPGVGFGVEGAGWTLRMARGLDPASHRRVEALRGWHAWHPAP
jgi:GNAT superfamily N-acetyltransferase